MSGIESYNRFISRQFFLLTICKLYDIAVNNLNCMNYSLNYSSFSSEIISKHHFISIFTRILSCASLDYYSRESPFSYRKSQSPLMRLSLRRDKTQARRLSPLPLPVDLKTAGRIVLARPKC